MAVNTCARAVSIDLFWCISLWRSVLTGRVVSTVAQVAANASELGIRASVDGTLSCDGGRGVANLAKCNGKPNRSIVAIRPPVVSQRDMVVAVLWAARAWSRLH